MDPDTEAYGNNENALLLRARQTAPSGQSEQVVLLFENSESVQISHGFALSLNT